MNGKIFPNKIMLNIIINFGILIISIFKNIKNKKYKDQTLI